MASAVRRQDAGRLEGDSVCGSRQGEYPGRNHHPWDGGYDGHQLDQLVSQVQLRGPVRGRPAVRVRFLCWPHVSGQGSFLTWINGGWGGSIVGLSSLDGNDASEN